jgi:hypothetical protein
VKRIEPLYNPDNQQMVREKQRKMPMKKQRKRLKTRRWRTTKMKHC